jgi:hypothetical protein
VVVVVVVVVVDRGGSESHATVDVLLAGEGAQELRPSEATNNKIPNTTRLAVMQLPSSDIMSDKTECGVSVGSNAKPLMVGAHCSNL